MTDIRSTTQIVEVVADYDGMARLTQQYVQVLYLPGSGDTFEESASNTLVLTQGIAEELLHSVENTLSLSSEAVVQLIKTLAVESELTLSDDVDGFNNTRIGNALALSQIVGVELVIGASAQNTLTLTDAVSFVGSKSVTAESALALTQSATRITTLAIQEASNELSLSQSVVDARLAENNLVLSQAAVGVIGGIDDTASSEVSLTQEATVELTVTVTASNTIVLTNDATNGHVAELSVSSALDLTQLVVGTTVEDYMILYAPFPAIAAAVILPRPLLDDKENLTASIEVRRAMDGTLYTFVKNTKTRLISYTFDMTRVKGLELQSFFDNYNGQRMKLQNWKGEVWDVQLLTNPLDFVQNRRSAPTGQVGINLQFEGVRISG